MSRLKQLLDTIKGMGAPTEADSERDGVFSHSGEVHAFAVGVYYGFIDFKDWDGLPKDYAEGKNIETGWYDRSGYVIGAAFRVACYLALGGYAAGVL